MTTPHLAEPPGRPRTGVGQETADAGGRGHPGQLAVPDADGPAAPGQGANGAVGPDAPYGALVPVAGAGPDLVSGRAPAAVAPVPAPAAAGPAPGPAAPAPVVTATPAAVQLAALFDALVGRAPVAFAFHDTAGRYVRVNDVLARLNGRAAHEHTGRTMPELLGEIGQEMEQLLARVVATGEPVVDLEVSVATGGPEPPQTWMASWYPAVDSRGGLVGVAFVATDATRLHEAEAELARVQARYRALADSAALDVLHANADGALDVDMPRWRAMTGQRRAEIAGFGWIEAVHPDDRDVVRGLWREVVATGEAFDAEFRVVAVDGVERVVQARAAALADPAGREWVGTTRDITDVRSAEAARAALASRAQAARDRTDHLHRVSVALSRAVTVDDAVAAVLEVGQTAFGASGRGVALIDDERELLRYRALHGYHAGVVRRWSEVSLGAVHPVAEAVRGGRPLFLSGRDELTSRWPVPEIAAWLAETDEHAWALLPLVTNEAPFGVLGFGFQAPRTFSAEDRSFLAALADQCSQALDRAKLYQRLTDDVTASRQAAQEARCAQAAAEAAGRRMDLLARLAGVVVAAPDPVTALREVAGALVAGVADVADVCEVFLVDDAAPAPAAAMESMPAGAMPAGAMPVGAMPATAAARAVASGGGAGPVLRREVVAVRPGLTALAPPADRAGLRLAPDPVGVVAVTGQPHVASLDPASFGSVSPGSVSVDAGWVPPPQTSQWLRHARVHTVAAVPLSHRGSVIGVMSIMAAGDRAAFTDGDVKFLTDVASPAAPALAHLHAERRDRGTALEVQRALMPATPSEPDGLDVAARYLPASGAAEVAGDWFDVIDLGAGRVGLAVGDVAGRGIRAVATMGQLRAAIRMCARLGLPPAEVLAHLDGLVTENSDWQLATCLYAVVETHTGMLTLANAGHPSPLVVAPDGLVSRLYMEVGTPLGVGRADTKEYVVRLGRGAVLALFTDGLLTRGGRDVDVGVSELAAALATAGGSLAARVGVAVDALGLGQYPRAGTPDTGQPASDDAVLLLARLPQEAGEAFAVEVPVGDGPVGLANARAHVRAAFADWQVGAEAGDAAVVVFSELVTNALLHGRLPFSAWVRRAGSRVIVEVADAAGGRPPRLRPADLDDEAGRGLELVSLLAARWGSRPAGDGKVVWAEVAIPGDPHDHH